MKTNTEMKVDIETKTCKNCNTTMYDAGCGNWVCATCFNTIKEAVMCQNCGKREATETWVGEGGTMALVHGAGQNWCKICCIREQLAYAIKQAERIPSLKEELKELEKDGN